MAQRNCLPSEPSGHDFYPLYYGKWPVSLFCVSCGRAVGLSPAEQFANKYPTPEETVAAIVASERRQPLIKES